MLIRARWAAVAAAVLVAVAPVSSCALRTGGDDQKLCALMPDAIGLYPGNPVTQMGYRIGTVTAVSPEPTEVGWTSPSPSTGPCPPTSGR